MPTFLSHRTPDSRSPGRRSTLLVLPLGLVLLASAGCTSADGADSPTETTTTSSEATTPSASPTPRPAEPTGIEGEELHGNADATDTEAVDGDAPRAAPAADVEALAALEALPVKGRAPKTGYDRDEFGSAWLDVDDNGCDTRNDMLARDLIDIVTSDGCTVTSGTLSPDPYTDTTIDFARGVATSSDVQIDHVVALSDAWQKGAQQLDGDSRVMFANDPLNLLAVDGPTNQAKGDSDAATWLPPNRGFRCEYVSIQIAVKAKYELWVTQAEKDAMARVLGDCDGQALPEDTGTVTGDEDALVVAPAPAPVVEKPEPEGPPTPAGPNCSEIGHPVHRGDGVYRSDLDSDGDGVGCESQGVAPAPAPAPVAPAPVAPAPAAPAPPAVDYANCSAVRAAGAAPIRAGQPGFGSHLDRDGDGIACE